MLKTPSEPNVDTFIEQATKIAEKYKKNPNRGTEAKQETRVLLEQFEEYLRARGLKASAKPRT